MGCLLCCENEVSHLSPRLAYDECVIFYEGMPIRRLLLVDERPPHKQAPSSRSFSALVDQLEAKLKELAALEHAHILSYKLTVPERSVQQTKTTLTYYLPVPDKKLETLEQVLSSNMPLNESRVVQLFRQLASALEYALSRHRLNHTCIGPKNIFVADDNAYICNFGLSKLVNDFEATDSSHGTVDPIPGTETAEAKDVSDLAFLISKALFGADQITSPGEQNFPEMPEVSRDMRELLRDMMASNPAHRPTWQSVLQRRPLLQATLVLEIQARQPVRALGAREPVQDMQSDLQPEPQPEQLQNMQLELQPEPQPELQPEPVKDERLLLQHQKPPAQDSTLSHLSGLGIDNPLLHSDSDIGQPIDNRPAPLSSALEKDYGGSSVMSFRRGSSFIASLNISNPLLQDSAFSDDQSPLARPPSPRLDDLQRNGPTADMHGSVLQVHNQQNQPFGITEVSQAIEKPADSEILFRNDLHNKNPAVDQQVDIFEHKIQLLKMLQEVHRFLEDSQSSFGSWNTGVSLNPLFVILDVCVLVKLMHFKNLTLQSLFSPLAPNKQPYPPEFRSLGHLVRLYHLAEQVCPEGNQDIEDKLGYLETELPPKFFRRAIVLEKLQDRAYDMVFKDVFLISLYLLKTALLRNPNFNRYGENECRVMEMVVLAASACFFEDDQWLVLQEQLPAPQSLKLTSNAQKAFVRFVTSGKCDIDPLFAEADLYLNQWKEFVIGK